MRPFRSDRGLRRLGAEGRNHAFPSLCNRDAGGRRLVAATSALNRRPAGCHNLMTGSTWSTDSQRSRSRRDTLRRPWPRSPISSRRSGPTRPRCSTCSASGRRAAAVRSTRTRRTRRSRWPPATTSCWRHRPARARASSPSLVCCSPATTAGAPCGRHRSRRSSPRSSSTSSTCSAPSEVGLATGDAAINAGRAGARVHRRGPRQPRPGRPGRRATSGSPASTSSTTTATATAAGRGRSRCSS